MPVGTAIAEAHQIDRVVPERLRSNRQPRVRQLIQIVAGDKHGQQLKTLSQQGLDLRSGLPPGNQLLAELELMRHVAPVTQARPLLS
ncbi:hypothetical protein D3C85_1718580 [compost metagenome]